MGICSLIAALYFPFGQAYGSPNFYFAGAALDQYGRVDRDPDDLPVVQLRGRPLYFALGVIAVRRKPEEKKRGEK